MRLNLENTELLLRENQPLRLINGKGVVVCCLAGTAWLTEVGDAADCFLEPGQERRLERDGLALIESMGKQATIRLKLVGGGAAVRPEYLGFRELKRRLTSLFEGLAPQNPGAVAQTDGKHALILRS